LRAEIRKKTVTIEYASGVRLHFGVAEFGKQFFQFRIVFKFFKKNFFFFDQDLRKAFIFLAQRNFFAVAFVLKINLFEYVLHLLPAKSIYLILL